MLEPYWNTDYAYAHSHRQQFDYLGLENLAQHLVFIHDSQLQIYQDNIQADIELIRQCRQHTHRLPVLTLDSNPYDVADYRNKLNQYLDPDQYFIFHSDIRESQSIWSNTAPWPSWLVYQHFLPDNQAQKPKKHRISFLSGIPRAHRMELYHSIKPFVSEQDVVVINSFQKDTVDTPKNLLHNIPWANNIQWFDNEQTEFNVRNDAHNDHPAYSACVNITGETLGTGNQVLPSEKTWKAYKSRCLVVNYGVEYMPRWLESVGIEIWKEFDKAVDYRQKIQLIQDLFKSESVFDFYNQNLDMIEHNHATVMSKQFLEKLAKPAVEKLQCLI